MEFSLEHLNTIELVLLGVFATAWLIQGIYLFYFYGRIAFYKTPTKNNTQPPVSIIMCAKNEEKNLRSLIPSLMEQEYPEFELVVVNDGSWDDSKDTLDAFSRTYTNLKIVDIPEEGLRMKGKKFAMTLGIKGSKYNRLLLTDADCLPNSRNWISDMMAVQRDENTIVLGFSPYQYKKGLLNKIIRFDTFGIGLNYLSFALAKMPYMGVGRNMSYDKRSFFKVGGFRKHSFISSGDDDLFINQIAEGNNTNISISEDSWMLSEPKDKWKEWWYQKKRHLSTAPHYKFKHKFLLAIFPMTYYLLSLSFVSLMILRTWVLLVIPIFVLRHILHLFIFKRSSIYLGQKKLTWLSPLWEFLLMILNPIIYLSNLINKPSEWN